MNRDDRGTLKRHIIDACVRAANNKGYSDAVGVLRGTLFLAEEPMSMDLLVEETGYSKSTVSSSMGLLENLGLVRRLVTPGDKRYHYVPVRDPDSLKKAMLSIVRAEIQLIMAALDITEKDLRAGETASELITEKMASIRHCYKQCDKLLDLVSRYTTDELIDLLERGGK